MFEREQVIKLHVLYRPVLFDIGVDFPLVFLARSLSQPNQARCHGLYIYPHQLGNITRTHVAGETKPNGFIDASPLLTVGRREGGVGQPLAAGLAANALNGFRIIRPMIKTVTNEG